MNNVILAFFSLLLFQFHVFAQPENFKAIETQFNNCVPFIEMPSELYEEIIQSSEKKKVPFKRRAAYTIPVVVHIVHKAGPENISDKQVFNAIELLNEDFSASNSDIENVPNTFKNIIGDANITFKLAQQAPDGSCTNGIKRYFSGYDSKSGTYWTDSGEEFLGEMQKTYHWDVDKYLNIYVVNKSGYSGITYFPYLVETRLNANNWIDGIMIRNYNLGNIGTAVGNNLPHVLSHEVGHYFDLLHIWGDKSYPGSSELDIEKDCNNDSSICPDFYCSSDDLVDDTPNTKNFYEDCVDEYTSCGSVDNVTNIMGYGCELMFTKGQVERMHQALNSSIARRNNLWSKENLAYTLNCSGTVASTPCYQIYGSYITSLEITKPGFGYIYTNAYTEIKMRHKVNDGKWIELPVTNKNYYPLNNIEKCAKYEFQISEKCGDIFSPWSTSRFFYTNGKDVSEGVNDDFNIYDEKEHEATFFNWSTGNTIRTLNNPSFETYHIMANDYDGCGIKDTIIVGGSDCSKLVTKAVVFDQSYYDKADGLVRIVLSGFSLPYTVTWSTGDIMVFNDFNEVPKLDNLYPGEYSYYIEDAEGCFAADTIIVAPVICNIFFVEAYVKPESSPGNRDGSIEAKVLGGTPPYTYLWSTDDTTYIINNLEEGLYSLNITDAVGCIGTVNNISVETSNSCPESNIITNSNLVTNDRDLDLRIYQVMNFIESNAIISAGENITFKAGKFISLNSGFEVSKGSNLSIEIEECNQ